MGRVHTVDADIDERMEGATVEFGIDEQQVGKSR